MWLTLSKALDRSQRVRSVTFLSSMFLYIMLFNVERAVVVDNLGLKPCWLLVIRLLVSKNDDNWSLIIFSRIFENIGKREIGR